MTDNSMHTHFSLLLPKFDFNKVFFNSFFLFTFAKIFFLKINCNGKDYFVGRGCISRR